MEMKIAAEKLRNPVRPRSLLKSEITATGMSDISEESFALDRRNYSLSPSYRPKKMKPNTMIPQEPTRRKPVNVDYLQERRTKREQISNLLLQNRTTTNRSSTEMNLPSTSFEDPDQIHKAAKHLERKAR
jgi:hypothetical protein